MHRYRIPALAAAAGLAVAACVPFRTPMKQAPVVQVNTRDANMNSRWNGTLASPVALVGAVQIRGNATMTPGSNAENTSVNVDITNASPGGLHPWQLHRGQCGADGGVFGSDDAYHALRVDKYGRASSSATLQLAMPIDGQYFVSLGASSANPETIVACGNLAPPAR
jgi:hypothetical protein